MGDHANIATDRFPAQGIYAGRSVRVCFDYDTSQTCDGVVVRDDEEDPGVMIIRLDDGRHVLSTECQWQPVSA